MSVTEANSATLIVFLTEFQFLITDSLASRSPGNPYNQAHIFALKIICYNNKKSQH